MALVGKPYCGFIWWLGQAVLRRFVRVPVIAMKGIAEPTWLARTAAAIRAVVPRLLRMVLANPFWASATAGASTVQRGVSAPESSINWTTE